MGQLQRLPVSLVVSDKVMHILQLDNKIRYSMFTKGIRQNNPDIILDHESELILTSESAFVFREK